MDKNGISLRHWTELDYFPCTSPCCGLEPQITAKQYLCSDQKSPSGVSRPKFINLGLRTNSICNSEHHCGKQITLKETFSKTGVGQMGPSFLTESICVFWLACMNTWVFVWHIFFNDESPTKKKRCAREQKLQRRADIYQSTTERWENHPGGRWTFSSQTGIWQKEPHRCTTTKPPFFSREEDRD